MDIEDILITVRYDLPPTLSEFYQVQIVISSSPIHIAHQIWLHTSLLMQQSGRCGRNGQQSVSYLFYSRVELKKADRGVTEFVECSENCRRRILLSALGSPEERQPARILCCDSCTPGELPAKLNIIPLPSVNIGN